MVNLEIGRRFSRRFAVSLAAYNLFDSDDNDITYFYESQFPAKVHRSKTAISTRWSRARCA